MCFVRVGGTHDIISALENGKLETAAESPHVSRYPQTTAVRDGPRSTLLPSRFPWTKWGLRDWVRKRSSVAL